MCCLRTERRSCLREPVLFAFLQTTQSREEVQMKQIIVCIDGTWNEPGQIIRKPAGFSGEIPTNVYRLWNAYGGVIEGGFRELGTIAQSNSRTSRNPGTPQSRLRIEIRFSRHSSSNPEQRLGSMTDIPLRYSGRPSGRKTSPEKPRVHADHLNSQVPFATTRSPSRLATKLVVPFLAYLWGTL